MLKAVLIDDDEISLKILQSNLARLNEIVEVVGAYTNSKKAVKAIGSQSVDLVMLDIEMPETNGLKLARELSFVNDNLAFVFVTAHRNYALEAFRANAQDYLLKPCSVDDLKYMLLKIRKRLRPAAAFPLFLEDKPFRIRTAGRLALYAAASDNLISLTDKITELFAFLLCHRQTIISKRELQMRFWPQQEPEQAMHSLYTAVYRLKKMLRQSNFPFDLVSYQGYYQVALKDCRIDFEVVSQLAADKQQITADRLHLYETVVNGYASRFLLSHDYAWAKDFADRIESDYRKIAFRLLQYYCSVQKLAEAFKLSDKLEQRFPYDDEIQSVILRLLSIQADEAAVRQRYEQYRQRLLNDCGLPPTVAFVRGYFKLLGH